MKKTILLLAALAISFASNAMKIVQDEIDEFTGNRILTTSWESVDKGNIHIRFRLQNNMEFLDFKLIYNKAIVIGDGDQLMFKSTADSIVSFRAIKTAFGSKGAGAVGLAGSGAWGVSATYSGDLSWFGHNSARLLRVYETDVYIDKEISNNDGKNLMQLYELFSSSLKGESAQTLFSSFELKFAKKSTKDKNWEIIKEEHKKNLSPDELSEIVERWEKQSTSSTEYKVFVKKSK